MSDTTTTPAEAIDAQVKSAIAEAIATPATFVTYLTLDRSGRSRVRSGVEAKAKATLAKATDLDGLAEAKRLAEITFPTSTATKVTVEPGAIVAQRIADLLEAADMLLHGTAVPAGIDGTYDQRDLPTPNADAAKALAEAKVTRGANVYSTEDAFRIAFAGKPVGTFLKVSEVCNAWHAAGGPDKASGRVSARLFAPNGCTVEGVEPVAETATTKAGVRNTVEFPAIEN